MKRPEEVQQRKLAQYLDAIPGLLWCHVGNERANKTQRQVLSGLGVKAGVPDVLIFDRVLRWSNSDDTLCSGIALELKPPRGPRGGKPGNVSGPQQRWILELRKRGWLARVCYGADEAIDWLEGLGVNKRSRER